MRWRVEERFERGVDKTEKREERKVMQVHKYRKNRETKKWNKPRDKNTVISHTPCFKQPNNADPNCVDKNKPFDSGRL
jgi:hypothetical protein